ncbi:murein L,D-transpeptidase family protein [Bdellovibrionota bacterium]
MIRKSVLFIFAYMAASPLWAIPVPPPAIPQGLVQFSSDSLTYALVVEKKTQSLRLYEVKNDYYSLVKSYKVATGEGQGSKLRVGDKRTPEGVYTFTNVLERKKILPKHGVRAFVTNYPNVFDRRANKTGSGIWLHGTNEPERISTGFVTEGCVALTNDDLQELQKYIKIGDTPLLVYESIPMVDFTALKNFQKEIHALIAAWKTAWEQENIKAYMEFYSPSKFRSKRMNWKGWRDYKNNLAKNYSNISLIFDQMKILNHQESLVVQFNQYYHSDLHEDFGKKTLYLSKEEGIWKIISEEWTAVNVEKS